MRVRASALSHQIQTPAHRSGGTAPALHRLYQPRRLTRGRWSGWRIAARVMLAWALRDRIHVRRSQRELAEGYRRMEGAAIDFTGDPPPPPPW